MMVDRMMCAKENRWYMEDTKWQGGPIYYTRVPVQNEKYDILSQLDFMIINHTAKHGM